MRPKDWMTSRWAPGNAAYPVKKANQMPPPQKLGLFTRPRGAHLAVSVH